jgi:tagatose 6-phosphate kinase
MSSKKIICITPNVALDRTLVVPDFAVGHISRIKRAIAVPGGKGLNVLRAIGILKGEPIAMGLLAGHTGRMIAEMVEKDGYPAEWTWYEGETRTCTIIAPPDGNSTVINESGQIEPSDWAHLVDDICCVADDVTTICLCGSLPLGAPESAPSDLITQLNSMNKQVWVDSSGGTLQNAIHAKPYAIKVNGDEIGGALNITVDSLASARDAGQKLIVEGISVVVITLGAEGAMLVTKDLVVKATPPKINPVDPIGSGDSVLAGLVTARANGDNFAEAIRAGVASGTVNALYAGGAQFPFEHYQTILKETLIETL